MELKYNIEGKELYKLIGQSTHNAIQKEVANAVKRLDIESMVMKILSDKCRKAQMKVESDGRLYKTIAGILVKNIDKEKFFSEIGNEKSPFFKEVVERTATIVSDRIFDMVVQSYYKK